MKHTRLFLAGLLFAGSSFTTAALAQDDYYTPPLYNYNDTNNMGYINRSYFSLGIGVAQPMGNYSSAVGSAYRGYAAPGSDINFNMGIPFSHSNFGVAIMYGAINNPFNVNKYAANVQTSDEGRAYAATVQDNYDISNILGGLYYTVPVHRVSFDFRAIAGVALCRFPEVGYAAYQYNPALGTTDTYSWDIASSVSSAFAYNLGADIRYNFRNMAILGGIDYMNARPYAATVEQYTNPAGYSTYTNVSGVVPVSALSFTLGFGFQLGR